MFAAMFGVKRAPVDALMRCCIGAQGDGKVTTWRMGYGIGGLCMHSGSSDICLLAFNPHFPPTSQISSPPSLLCSSIPSIMFRYYTIRFSRGQSKPVKPESSPNESTVAPTSPTSPSAMGNNTADHQRTQ